MIPKILHLCWLSGDAYPPLIEKCVDSWKEKCPDYEIKIWNTQTFNMSSSVWVQEAFEKKKYAFAADYIRLWAVYNYGGIYLDSDVEVIKNFDDLLELNSFMGFSVSGNYEPAIFGAIPQQEWIGKCLRYYDNRHFIKSNGRLDTLTIPEIINPILQKEYALKTNELRHQISHVINGNLKLFPYEYFNPDVLNLRITNATYTVHHYTSSWATPTQIFRSKVFCTIARNKVLFFLYTNTYQKMKRFIKKVFFKQEYYIHKHL